MEYTKTKLKNGLRIITVPVKNSKTVTVMALVETGSDYEPKELNGISHFLEHMCFKGTDKRTNFEIMEELDGIGASTNAFTSDEFTGYYSKAHYKHTNQLIDVVSDIYLNSIFPKEEIEKERGVILQEISMNEDEPMRSVGYVFAQLMYGDQPAGRPTLGPAKNIKSISQKDFIEYKDKHYVSDATVVVIAGNIKEKEVIGLVKNSFSKIKKDKKAKKPPVIELQTRPQIKVKKKKTDQIHLILGFRAFDKEDDRLVAGTLASVVLGKGMSSRLFKKMRDELGLCYYVRAYMGADTDHGSFFVHAGVDKNKLKDSIKAIVSEFKKLLEEEVGPKELKKAKEYLTGNMAMNLESSDQYAEFYGFQELLRDKKIKSLEEKIKEIRKVTAKDIQKVAKDIFKEENMNLAIIGDVKDPQEIKKLMKL